VSLVVLRLLRTLALPCLLALAVSHVAAAALSSPERRGAAADDWPAFGRDAQLTNFVRSESITAGSARRLGVVWSTKLDGAVVAQPLLAHVYGRTLLLAATEAGSVYALDAVTGRVDWQRSFDTVATPGCGTYGFSSTGAVDLERGLVYVAGADGLVHGLSLSTGADASGWPVRITRRTAYTYVWGGLRIAGGRLYVPVASYCDELDPRGRAAEGGIVSLDLAHASARTVFDPVPGFGNLGGDWAWGGVSLEPDGSYLYAGIGNAEQYDPACNCYDETAGYGDSLVKLTPGLEVVDSDRPYTPPGADDEDLGGTPVLFERQGCPPLAAANSKIGTLFIWERSNLSRGPVQSVPLSDGIDAFVGEPSWSPDTGMLYDAGATFERGGARLGTGVIALKVGSDCRVKPVWSAVLGDGPQPPPLVVGDVVVAAGGSTGGYEAHDAATGVLLWKFSTGDASTLGPPIEGYGTIFAGDGGGTVRAFQPRVGRR
jgi:outer membrane protein assembly factor BamB